MKNARLKIIIVIVCLALYLTGCAWFADHRVPARRQVDEKMLSDILTYRYERIKEIEADIALKDYYILTKEKNYSKD